LIDLLNY